MVPPFGDLDVSGPTTCVSLRDIVPPGEDTALSIRTDGGVAAVGMSPAGCEQESALDEGIPA